MHPARLLAAILLVGSLCSAAEPPGGLSKSDGKGDRLPPGAVARLGSSRRRQPDQPQGQGRPVKYLTFTADSKRILTSATLDDLCCWDAATGKLCPVRAEDKKHFKYAWLTSAIGENTLRLSQGDIEGIRFHTVLITIRRKPSRVKGIGIKRTPRWPAHGKSSRRSEMFGSVNSWSATGKRLLIEQKKEKRSTLIVLDMESGKKIREFPQKEGNACAALSPDGRTLAMVVADYLIFLDVDTGRQRRYVFPTGETTGQLSALRFSPDSSRIAFLGNGGRARIVSVRDGQLLGTIASADPILGMAFSADGKICVCDTGDSSALWEVATCQRIRSIKGSSCLFSPDTRLLALQSEAAICLHDLYSGKKIRTCKDPAGISDNGHFIFSPDGRRLATASKDTTILVWDTSLPESAEQTAPLDEKILERLWKDLEKGQASAAYEAMGRLIANPRNTLRCLRKRLQKVPPVEESRLRQWIAELDSDSFANREAATQALSRLGPLAASAIRKALAGSPSLELRLRLTALLRPLEGENTRLSAEELAHVRAIQVLERIGTEEARQLLKLLAEGAEGLARTRDAQEALQRMGQRGN